MCFCFFFLEVYSLRRSIPSLDFQEAEEVLYKFLSFVLGRVDWARKYIANSFD